MEAWDYWNDGWIGHSLAGMGLRMMDFPLLQATGDGVVHSAAASVRLPFGSIHTKNGEEQSRNPIRSMYWPEREERPEREGPTPVARFPTRPRLLPPGVRQLPGLDVFHADRDSGAHDRLQGNDFS